MHLRACIGVGQDLGLIGHFLAHYRSLGIRHYHLVLRSTHAPDPDLDRAERLIAEGCDGLDWRVRTWVAAHFQASRYQAKLDQAIRGLDDQAWVLTVEADELQAYPGGLQAVLDECVRGDFDCVHGVLVERLPAGPRAASRFITSVGSTTSTASSTPTALTPGGRPSERRVPDSFASTSPASASRRCREI